MVDDKRTEEDARTSVDNVVETSDIAAAPTSKSTSGHPKVIGPASLFRDNVSLG